MNRFKGLKNIRSRFDKFINSVSKFFKSKGYTSDYNLWEAMHENEIGSIKNSNQRDRKAVEWFTKFVKKDSRSRVKAKLLEPSMLYMFSYDTPKYESTLDYFDTQPLVLVMGQMKTKLGIREVGINMHLLPPQIRKAVLFKVYTIYKMEYNKAMKVGRGSDFNLDWRKVQSFTKALGVGFAVRMYIPELRKSVVQFPHIEWERAIWIPSKGYAKISRVELEREWKKYILKQKKSDTQRLASTDSHL